MQSLKLLEFISNCILEQLFCKFSTEAKCASVNSSPAHPPTPLSQELEGHLTFLSQGIADVPPCGSSSSGQRDHCGALTLCTSHLNPHTRHGCGKDWGQSPHIHQLVFPLLSLLHSLIFRRLEVVRGGSKWTTSSHLKIRLTSSQMSGGFRFNLSAW